MARPLLTLLLLTLCAVGNAVTPEQRELIDELVENYMRDNFTPALGLAIVEKGDGGADLTLATAYGNSRLESNTAATNQTLFAIASISKSFTGILTAKVLHEKFPELEESVLDTPIRTLAPDFALTFSDRFRSEVVSFRDLLSHRSCLFNVGLDIMLGMNVAEDYIYRTRYQLESHPFRVGYEYNNNLFALASEIIAHIAGMTFQELASNFFRQLGMTDTRFIDKDGAHELLPAMSHAYFRRNNQTHQYNTAHLRRISVILGAGAILSTPADMSQYLKFHLNKGRVGDVQVIPEEVYGRVLKPASIVPGGDGPFGLLTQTGMYGYGMGLTLAVYKGNPWVQHGGYWQPYESSLGLFHQQNFGIFITTNGPGSAGTYPGQIPQQLLEVMIFDIVQGNRTSLVDMQSIVASWPRPEPFGANLAENPNRKFWQPPGSPARNNRTCVKPEDILGQYGSPADGEVVITLDGSSLAVNFGSWGLGRLVQQSGSETVFDVEWISPVEDDFYSYGNIGAIPKFVADFGVDDEFELRATSGERIVFVKGRGLGTLPAVPWAPDSCAPCQGGRDCELEQVSSGAARSR